MIALKMLFEMLTPEQPFGTVVLVAERAGNGPALAGFTLDMTLQTINPGERTLLVAKTIEGSFSIVDGDPVLDHLHLLLALALALVGNGSKVDAVDVALRVYRDRTTHQPWIVKSGRGELRRSRPQLGVGLQVFEKVEGGCSKPGGT